MNAYRCWYEDQPEPTGFPIEAPNALSAAVEFVNQDEDKDTDELAKNPALVMVRGNETDLGHPMPAVRIRVTASIEVTIWSYPDDVA